MHLIVLIWLPYNTSFHSSPLTSLNPPSFFHLLFACHGLQHHGWLNYWFLHPKWSQCFAWWRGISYFIYLLFQHLLNKQYLTIHFYIHRSNGLQLVSLCQKFVEFVAMRLDTRKMVSCLWRVMCVDSRFVVLVMTMKGVKGISAVLSATLAISVIRVSLYMLSFSLIIFSMKMRLSHTVFWLNFSLQDVLELLEMRKTLMRMILMMNFRLRIALLMTQIGNMSLTIR